MPLGIINVEWLNANAQRAYPLTSTSTRRDTSNTIEIPDALIVELYFPVHAGLEVEPDKFFLYKLGIFGSGIYIAIAYDDGTGSPPIVAATNIAASTHTENRSYELPGAGDFSDSVGSITIGQLSEINRLAPGQYTFTPAAGQLETDVIRPVLRGVQSVVLVNGSDRTLPLYGDIELVAGANIRLVVNDQEDQDPQIIISAISGEGLNEECECEANQTGPCIKTINGVPPESDGNFRLQGDACMQITELTNGLAITDTCSSPCCGCAELDALRTQINRFSDAKLTLENFVGRLSTEVTQMNMVVLGSRLSDRGCISC